MEMQSINDASEDHGVRAQLLTLAGHLFYQLARMFLRHNVLIPELKRVMAWSATNAALNEPEFAVNGRIEYKQTLSHAAVLTGMTRGEVKKASEYEAPPVSEDGGDLNRLIRILTAWRTDPDYLDESDEPRVIPLRGPSPSLHQLCRKHGRDTPVRAVADWLVQNGNAEWVDRKCLRLLTALAKGPLFECADIQILAQMSSDYLHSLQQAFDPNEPLQPRMLEAYFLDIDERNEKRALEFVTNEIDKFNRACAKGLEEFRTDEEGASVVRVGVGSYSIRRAPLLLAGQSETGNL